MKTAKKMVSFFIISWIIQKLCLLLQQSNINKNES